MDLLRGYFQSLQLWAAAQTPQNQADTPCKARVACANILGSFEEGWEHPGRAAAASPQLGSATSVSLFVKSRDNATD